MIKHFLSIFLMFCVFSCVAFATVDSPPVDVVPDSVVDIPEVSVSSSVVDISEVPASSSVVDIPDVPASSSVVDIPTIGVIPSIIGQVLGSSSIDLDQALGQTSDQVTDTSNVVSCTCSYDFGTSFSQLNTLLLLLFTELGVISLCLFCKR